MCARACGETTHKHKCSDDRPFMARNSVNLLFCDFDPHIEKEGEREGDTERIREGKHANLCHEATSR